MPRKRAHAANDVSQSDDGSNHKKPRGSKDNILETLMQPQVIQSLAQAIREELQKNEVDDQDMEEGEVLDLDVSTNKNQGNGIPIVDDLGEIWREPGSPLIHLVPEELKTKIRDNKFIELDKLYAICIGQNKDCEDDLTLTRSSDNNMVFKAKSNKRIHNIFQFMRAFYLFAAVRSHYYSVEGPQLFHYMYEILDIHAQGGQFLTYDRQFRMIREKTNRAWDNPLDSFFVKSILKSNTQQPTGRHFPKANRSSKQGNLVKGGRNRSAKFCFRFQDGEACSSYCPFRHQCELCQGQHGSSQCPGNANNASISTSYTSPANSGAGRRQPAKQPTARPPTHNNTPPNPSQGR